MGFNIDWIAVKGVKASVLKTLGFEAVGEATNPSFEDYACAKLPGGWVVITAMDRMFDVEEALVRVGGLGLSLGCEMSETVMTSRTVGFEYGMKSWVVAHDPDREPDGVRTEGAPPALFREIVERLQAEQRAAGNSIDYLFDAPVQLAAALCGFRPDLPTAVTWTALRKKGPHGPSDRKPRSLTPQIKRSLTPLLGSRGFKETKGRRDLFPQPFPHEFFRIVDGLHHLIQLDFGWSLGRERGAVYRPFIDVGFSVHDPSISRGDLSRLLLTGQALYRHYSRPSLWASIRARFEPRPLEQLEPTVADLVASALEGAREDILQVDAFLTAGVRGPRVHVARGSAMETWPLLTGDRQRGTPRADPAS